MQRIFSSHTAPELQRRRTAPEQTTPAERRADADSPGDLTGSSPDTVCSGHTQTYVHTARPAVVRPDRTGLILWDRG